MHLYFHAQDGDFSEKRFQDLVNAALVNDLGNCLNRTLGLLHKYCEGKLPEAANGVSLPKCITASFQKCLFFERAFVVLDKPALCI